MIIDDKLLGRDERAAFALRALFEANGFSRFSMGRFEKYDLYAGNKDFLASDRMITFTDVDGTLMALKPDVTLSVIRRSDDGRGRVNRVYYNENVYRAPRGGGGFREIMQTGVECIGELSGEDISRTVALAAESMETVGEPYVLNISHLGFTSGLFASAGVARTDYPVAIQCVREKNAPAMEQFCRRLGIEPGRLMRLIGIHGGLGDTLPELRDMCPAAGDGSAEMSAALEQLDAIYRLLDEGGKAGAVRLDFSVVNNMAYYDGVVFQGYIRGIPDSVLSGGQYDSLARKMGKRAGAIGFAIYLNKLEYLEP